MTSELRIVAILLVGMLDYAAFALAIAIIIDGHRRLRFSLQALLFVMTLIAVNSGAISIVLDDWVN